MCLNLPISPLDNVDYLGTQKCLLPPLVLSNIGRPGQWAKCFFFPVGEERLKNFAVCRIFPKEGDCNLLCFLDTSVCGTGACLEDRLILDSVIPLDENETELTNVALNFMLRPEYYIEHSGTMSATYLKYIAQTLLQRYNMSASCAIHSLELLQNGVEFVSVKVDGDNESGNFIITDNTVINTADVSLGPHKTSHDFIPFDIRPLKAAQQELRDLIDIVRMQSGQKNSITMSRNALIIGALGCGKTTLVESLLASLKCNVHRISTVDVLKQHPGETEDMLRKIFQAASNFEKHHNTKEHIAIVVEDIHILCPQSKSLSSSMETGANALRIMAQLLSLIDELSKKASQIICIATTNNTEAVHELAKRPGRFEREIHVSPLSELDRKEAFHQVMSQYIPKAKIPENLFHMVSKHTQGFAIADIALLCRNVAKAILTKSCDNMEVILKDCLRTTKPASLLLSDVKAYKTNALFSDIGGMCRMKKEMEISVLAGLQHREAFRRFGLNLPKGVLLYGPPGCAKTTVAKCLATEAKMTFIATSGAEVYSPYVGCAEAFIAKIFNTARKNAPCLIFLDELDSLVGRRALGSSASSDVQTRVLSTLLTEMDGIITSSNAQNGIDHILVVGATNRPDMVDDALLRPGRFDKLIHVPAPDIASRSSILRLYQHRMPFSKSLDLNELAERTDNYSGADICNLCNEAALHAFQRDCNAKEIIYDDFDKVIRASKSSLTQEQINRYYNFQRNLLQ